MSDTLRLPVRQFVDGVSPALADLGSSDPAADVVAEAYEVVSAFIDADGAHTDEELWALIGAFSGLMDTHIHHATPADIRATGLVAGKRSFIDKPSLMFDTLIAGDRARATNHAWTYYVHALRLAHNVAALDTVTQHAELDAIERFRRTLLTAISDAGLPRGPRRPTGTTAGAPGPATATQAEAEAEAAVEVELPPARPLEELLEELEGLVGLDAVKREVKLVTNLLQVQKLRAEKGLKTGEQSHHLVFTGNPGTGKTTVARLLAQIYRTLEVVPKGHLVETDRSGLIAGGSDYRFDEAAGARLAELLEAVPRDRGFGNGRLARNVFEESVAIHASRVVQLEDPDADVLATLTVEDLPEAIATS